MKSKYYAVHFSANWADEIDVEETEAEEDEDDG